jgi:TolB-like protein
VLQEKVVVFFNRSWYVFHKELFMRIRPLLFPVVLCLALVPAVAQTQAPISIDDAITNAVRYLNTTIPLRSQVAVIHFGTNAALQEYLLEKFTNKLKANPQLTITERRNTAAIIRQFNLPAHEDLPDATAREVGKRLNVNVVITGSVSQTNSVYRLKVQALAVQSNQVYWSHTYTLQSGQNLLSLLTIPRLRPQTGASSFFPNTRAALL